MPRLPRPEPQTAALCLLAASFASLALATWWEGKRLWAAYNALGVVFTLVFALVLARLRARPSALALGVCYATLCLHYVGGSLGGHFGVTGINGLYAVFPWYDRVTHFGGAAGVTLLLLHLAISLRASRGWVVPDVALAWAAFGLGMAMGVAVELFEFAAWTFFGTVDQGFYTNTMMDLLTDTCGCAFGASAGLALRPREAPQGAAPGAAEA